jgi:predicted nucleic acid-binding protein
VDTGYLVALEDANDDNYPRARGHLDGPERIPRLTTASDVLDEMVGRGR